MRQLGMFLCGVCMAALTFAGEMEPGTGPVSARPAREGFKVDARLAAASRMDSRQSDLARPERPTLVRLRSHPEQTRHASRHWGPVLTDIARHLPDEPRYQDAFRRYIEAGDLVTAGHEWTHFLNERLTLHTGVGFSAYYLLNDSYTTLRDPEGLRGIVPSVPVSLRGELYDLYLVQNAANARIDPLYLLDEWVAYANDVAVAVDQLENGKPLNIADARTLQTRTAGNVLEFTFYGLAVGMAVSRHDPAYYAGQPGRELRTFIAWHAARSLDLHARALRHDRLCRGDARSASLIRAFNHEADASSLRTWAKSDLGESFARTLLSSRALAAAPHRGAAPAARSEAIPAAAGGAQGG